MLDSVSVPVAPGDVSLADKPLEITSLPLVPPPQAANTAADRKANVAERGEEYRECVMSFIVEIVLAKIRTEDRLM